MKNKITSANENSYVYMVGMTPEDWTKQDAIAAIKNHVTNYGYYRLGKNEGLCLVGRYEDIVNLIENYFGAEVVDEYMCAYDDFDWDDAEKLDKRYSGQDYWERQGAIKNARKPIKSGRFIKSGAGAGYDVTIEGIELDSQNYKVISDEITNEEYNEHLAIVEVPVKPCLVDKWTAQSYYDGIDSDWYGFGDDDRKIDGGKAVLRVFWTEQEEGRWIDDKEFENVEEAVAWAIPSSIDIKVLVGAGWIHSNLPVEEVHFEDEYHHNEIDLENDGYAYLTESVDLICPNICQDINAFFENPEEYYDDDPFAFNQDDEIESSRKPIKSGMSYQDALVGFTSMGKPWGDYWEMQQDWTAYVDSLERDGEVDYEEAKNWDNPCTPQTFKDWINE